MSTTFGPSQANQPDLAKQINKGDKWYKRYWQTIALSFVLLLALALRLYRLDVPSFYKGYDEGWTFINSAYPLSQIVPHLWPDHTPLFFLLNHFWLDLINYSHDRTLLRFPTVLTGTLVVIATYFLAYEISKNKKVALLAAAGTAISPLLVDLSRYFRMYSLLALLSILAAYFLLKALRTNRILDWAAFIVFSVLNLYTHYDALFALGELGVFCLLWAAINLLLQIKFPGELGQRWDKLAKAKLELRFEAGPTWRRILGLGLSGGLIFLLYLPWLGHFLSFIQSPDYGLGRGFAKAPLDFVTIYKYVAQTTFGEGFGFGLGLLLSLAGLGYLLVKRIFYGLFCGIYFWLMLLIIINSPQTSSSNLLVSPRYYCFVTPVFMLMVAQGIMGISKLVGQNIGRIATNISAHYVAWASKLVLVALLSYQAIQTYGDNLTYQPQRTYLEDTATFLSQNLQADDVVLTAAPHFDSDIFKRNYLISQTLVFISTPDDKQQAAFWSHFVEFEQLNSYSRIKQLQSSSANLWLLAVLDGTSSEVTAKKQRIAELNSYTSHCFEVICLIQSIGATNQYLAVQTLLHTFGFLNDAFGPEVATLNELENRQLQPSQSAIPTLAVPSGEAATTVVPINLASASQSYYLQFEYLGQPSRIFVEARDANDKVLALLPDKYGYTPTPGSNSQWLTDGIIFEAPSGTTHLDLRVQGENGPAQVKNMQLFMLVNK